MNLRGNVHSLLTPGRESALMRDCDAGSVVVVPVSGCQMVPVVTPYWLFGLRREGGNARVRDSAAVRDDHGMAAAPETDAVLIPACERMTRSGRDRLIAASVIRKGVQ